MADAPADPFADFAIVAGKPPAASPPEADQTGAVADTLSRNPLVSVPLNAMVRAGQAVKSVADSTASIVPGIFQRDDVSKADPFAAFPVIGGSILQTGPNGHVKTGSIPGAERMLSPREMTLSELDNLRTGLQRGVAADASAMPSIVDLAHRGLFYGTQAAYNLTPPMRFDLGKFLYNTFDPLAAYNTLYRRNPDGGPIEPPHYVVNLGGSNTGMHGFGAQGGQRVDPVFGRAPDPWTETYSEASQRKTPSGADNIWASPLKGSGLPGETIQYKDVDASTPQGEGAGLLTPRMMGNDAPSPLLSPQGQSAPTSYTIPKVPFLPELNPASITKGVDDAVTGIGTGVNSLSDYLARQQGKKAGPHVDLSPHVPSNRFEQYTQELAAGVPAPGKLLTRMAVAGASARVGQIPGIEDTQYELPARIAASIITGIPFAYRRGLPGQTGQVIRQNVEDLGEYSPPGTKPGWPEWLHRGGIIPPARPIPGTARTALEGLEEQQQQLNAMGLTVMPAELAQAGRGDVPSLVALTHRVNKTAEGGPPIRSVFAKRPDQMNTVIGNTIDEVAGPRPTDQAAVSGRLATAAKNGGPQAGQPADFADTTGEFTGGPARQQGPPGIYGAADPSSAPVFGIEPPVTPPAAAPATPTTPAVPAAPPGRVATTRLADVADAPTLPGSTALSAMDRAKTVLFNADKSSPAAVAEAAQALNAHDPDAWRGLVSEWLHRERARAYGGGTDPEMGAKFASRVFGDPDKKAILRASLENIVGPDGQPLPATAVEKALGMVGGLENTDTLSRAAAKGTADVVPQQHPGMVKAFFGGVGGKIPGVSEAVNSFRTGSQARLNANLGTILSSPTGVSQLLDLAWRTPQRERQKATMAMLLNDSRNVARSIMFGNGGGLPRSPLLNPPDDQ